MKILHAPYEVCGLLNTTARALRALGAEAVSVSYLPDPFGVQNDIVLHLERYPRLARYLKTFLFTARALGEYDVFHLHSYGLLSRDWDLPLIKAAGKKLVVCFHGSEIRNQELVLQIAEQYAHPARGNIADAPPALSTQVQMARVARWRKYADLILVSTPDLLAIVPEATWIPHTLDLSTWKFHPLPHHTAGAEGRIKILHAPSRRRMKGTGFVTQSVEKLRSTGHNIELILAEGISYAQIQRLYLESDIVIDQLLIGAYGLVSVEAMATGRPVICYISPEAARTYPPSLPVVSATPASLEEALLDLIYDAGRREHLATAGREYVEAYHDARSVARFLLNRYQSWGS